MVKNPLLSRAPSTVFYMDIINVQRLIKPEIKKYGSHTLCLLRVMFIVLTISACDSYPPKPLRIGSNVWIGYETLYLARDLGYLDKLPVKLVEMPSATDVSHAFRNNNLELAALTLDETLTLLQTEQDIKVILVMDFSHGGDVLLAKNNITSLQQLKGQRVGVENTAVGAVLLDGALTAGNLQADEIKLVPLTVNDHLSAFLNDEVDAIVTFEPVKSQILSAGAIALFDSSLIPGRIVDVLITRESIIKQYPAILQSLIVAYFSALEYRQLRPVDAARRIGKRMGLTADSVQPQYQGIRIPNLIDNRRLLASDNTALSTSTQTLATLMLKKKLLFRNINTGHLLDDSLLPEAK